MFAICGNPGEGLHKYRVAGFAVIDVLIAVCASALVSFLLKKNFFVVTGALFLLGIGVHAALGIDTALNKRLKCLIS